MKIIEKEYFTELYANEGMIIVSKSTHIDEETGNEVYDVISYEVCLSKLDSIDEYTEIEDSENLHTEE